MIDSSQSFRGIFEQNELGYCLQSYSGAHFPYSRPNQCIYRSPKKLTISIKQAYPTPFLLPIQFMLSSCASWKHLDFPCLAFYPRCLGSKFSASPDGKAIIVLVGYRCFSLHILYRNHWPKLTAPQQTRVAPPVSIASISERSMGCRLNLAGSSLRSKYSPLAGVTAPKEWPEVEPRLPSALVFARPRGPCCCAFCL